MASSASGCIIATLTPFFLMLIVRSATNPGDNHNIFLRLAVIRSNKGSMEFCISLTKGVAFGEVV